jgi:PAS domain S-box-containing protein
MSTALKKALRAVHNVIIREKQPARLIEKVCALLVDEGGYSGAWVVGASASGVPAIWAGAGWGEAFGPFAKMLAEGTWPRCRSVAEASEIDFAAVGAPAICAGCSLGTMCRGFVLPLQVGEVFLGLLGVLPRPSGFLDDEEKELLIDCAANLAFALDAARVDTERRAAEEQLRFSEERFAKAFHSSPYAITLTSATNSTLVEVNEGFVEATGYAAQEALGKTSVDLGLWVNDEDRLAVVAAAKKGERIVRRQFEFRRKDGQIRTGLFSADRLIINKEAFVLSSIDDVTARTQAEEGLRRLNLELEQRVLERTAKLEQSNKELESFSYSVSHDLRAPLRAIDGFTRVLSTEHATRLDEEGQRLCSIVRENTERMARLIDDLLAFSRIGRTEVALLPIDMGAMVSAVYEELTTPQSRARIDFQLGPLPPAIGDTTLIRQTWANLLDNAIKFSSKREKAVIRVTGEEGQDENAYAVKDNGAGFEMQYVGKLFGVFQRLHNARDFQGTGVGLAIIARVMSRHGGRVWAEGAPDQGATFTFSLPRRRGSGSTDSALTSAAH